MTDGSRVRPRVSVTAPGERELCVRRGFDAPARLVFRTFTEPALLRRWFGAEGWQLVQCEIDLRPGGTWRFVSRDGRGHKMGHRGVYWEVRRPERLVYTETYDDQWVPGEAVVTVDFEESGGGTELTTLIRYPTKRARDLAAASPMERGLAEGYLRLADVLAELTEGVATP
ncbi:uncharacterized protein YndB with AHSA1/START domain [Crossiella equi]|uniref:Uncharacterized protein YndB with AHSA1/START domain n=1 Tax=Crossiella equi TaxID=130796 RepID=A0ABS5AQD5_9PSEU|nr:SRPBCC family protein [Crossiella equi]MBP2478785.1 uncharacterized protein YndB with AHSA1/START domain [Crossiella equi]